MVISTGAGGGLDASARLIARHMANHIPGKPSIIARNMTGAGHLQATNYVYAQAPRDGSVIAAILPAFVGYQVLDGRGAQYDAARFAWLGASDADNQNLYVWHAAGVRSVADARRREVLMGATGAGSYTVLWPTLMNNLLGTRFKLVSGYKSTSEIHLAMQRGEIEGRAGNLFSSLKSQNPDWLKQGSIDILVQIGVERDREFDAVPLLTDLAETAEQRRIIALISGEIGLGKPFLTTPDVPADRLAALRSAFEATTRDAEYLADAQRLDIGVRAMPHGKLKSIADAILATPADEIAKAKAAIVAAP
jgi:tripartite-type tricarboxylate transporter receptor subunit TctC